MRFKLHIDCDNAAFEGGAAPEIVRILRALADRMEGGLPPSTLRDANGNTVGAWEISEGEG